MLDFLNVGYVGKYMGNVAMNKKETDFADNYISCCPTCGGPVLVKGKTTKYFVPLNKEILKEFGFTDK